MGGSAGNTGSLGSSSNGSGSTNTDESESKAESDNNTNRTWIHDIFQGTTVNETRCLCCETITTRDENFLDLSLEISHNSSITSCLRNFSKTETLADEDKFYCDVCCSHQEATRRMRIKKLPSNLALHLKRFKFVEHLGRLKKLSCRYGHTHDSSYLTNDSEKSPLDVMICTLDSHTLQRGIQ